MPPKGSRRTAAATAARAAAFAAAEAEAAEAANASPSAASSSRTPARSPTRSSASTPPLALVYPSGASLPSQLNASQATLKVARHSRCQAEDGSCSCLGLRPPPDAEVIAQPVNDDSLAAGSSSEWKQCGACGHAVESHGTLNDSSADEEERTRRIKVAVRLDELLEDKKKLLDFEYTDEDVESLKKQLKQLASPEHTRKRSSSQSPLRGSSSPVPQKKRRLVADSPGLGDSPITTPPRSPEPETPPPPPAGASSAEAQDHPAQSTKGAALGPEEALEQAKEAAEKEQREREKEEREKLVAPGADLGLVTAGISIDPGEAQGETTQDEDSSIAVAPPPPKRERPAVIEERTGLIQFRVVSNSALTGTPPQDLVILTGLKNIFQRQLPKMPREYITRLVLDKNHVSMAIVKRGLQVVGGITYRPFNKRKFAEIVFCAIDSSQQVKGYGQHLMNHLKDHVKESSDVMHFLTYADNYAIGYFKKQGFTKEISLPRSVWVGYIKDYEGGTLMQCSMVPRVRYLEVHEMLARQKELVLAKIRSISKSHIVHPGLKVFKDRARAKEEGEEEEDSQPAPSSSQIASDDSEAYLAHIKSQFKVQPSDVPGLSTSGWTPEMDVLSRRPRRGPHHGLLRSILVELTNHASAWPFLRPVNADEVPDYYTVITEPMDLATMEGKLEANQYAQGGLDALVKDAQRVFDNCRAYNPKNSPYAKCADKMERFLKENLPMWKQSAGIL